MSKNFFIISKAEGKKFAKISGDYNKIHIDEKVGYNSIYGNIVCHGVLVLLKFLKKVPSESGYLAKFFETYKFIKSLFF